MFLFNSDTWIKRDWFLNQFLDIVSVSDGRADTIVSAIKAVLLKKDMPTETLYGLGTDGAPGMTGIILFPLFSMMFFEEFMSEFSSQLLPE